MIRSERMRRREVSSEWEAADREAVMSGNTGGLRDLVLQSEDPEPDVLDEVEVERWIEEYVGG